MTHRDGTGESQGCVGAMGGLWGVSNMLVCISGGPLQCGGGCTLVGARMHRWEGPAGMVG